MKRLVPDQQDPFGDGFDPADAGFNSGFMPFAAGSGVRGGSHDLPPTVTPALTGEAISSAAAFTGTAATVVVSSLGVGVANANGFNIDLVFDAAAAAAPAFMSGIEQAAMILGQTITNKITVNINIDYSGSGGGASAGPSGGYYEPYSTVRADLIANAAPGDTTFNALPTGSTIQGQSQVAVWNAQLKLWGLLAPNDTTTTDGSATFATDVASNALVGVALHELTHALGRVPYGSQPDIFDFYRFTSPAPSGTYLFTSNIPASAAYFSLDGGHTSLAAYGLNSDPSDFLNSGAATNNDPFDEYYTPGTTYQYLTTLDKEQIDALGFNTMTASQSIAVVATASEAVQGGAAVALLGAQPTITDTASTTLASAIIKIANAGSAAAGDKLYVNGIQNGSLGNGVTVSWNATTNTMTLTGNASLAVYDTLLSEVTYQDTGTDSSTGSHPLRTVTWSVNDGTASFNTTSQITVERAPVVSAANVGLGSTSTPVAASSLFTVSDSDGDAIATYAFKDSGNGHFILNGVAQANNQEIDVTAAQLAQLTYLGTGGVDSLQVRVNDGTAWGSWQGLTVTTTVVRSISVAATATEAVQGGAAVALLGEQPTITDSASTTLSSASIKIANVGSSAVAGDKLYVNGIQNGSLGNGVTASWNATTDSLTLTGSASLAVYDTLLSEVTYQDTGIDSSTGSHPVRTVAWSANDGTASFNTTSQITVDRAPVVSAANVVLSASTPVAASSLFTASDSDGDAIATYAFMDSGNGHFVLNGATQANNQEIDVTAAQLAQLTYLGTGGLDMLQVRINDGTWSAWDSFTVTAPLGTIIESYGSTSLTQLGSNYYLDSNSTGTGPELNYNGTPITVGQTGIWTPIGGEQTSTGYEVAWKETGANLYMIWNTDSNGTYLSSVQGNGTWVESYETSFQQDLNGDSVIGVAGTVIELYGSTSLTQLGSNYYLDSNSTGTGPELNYNGTPITVGQTGIWTPIGGEQTSTGYEVAWKETGANLYMIWNTDSNGTYLSSVQGNGTWVESYETSFQQDLNGDSVIGVAGTVIESYGSTSLTQLGSNYYLDSNSTGTGPELNYNGTPITVGQTGIWTPIGGEQTSTGYEVAWKETGANLYMIWNTDSNGTYLSSVQGNGTWVESYETSFQQDLNGDSVIGVAGTVIESYGSTSLTQLGSNYYLDSNSTGTGPELNYNGTPITVGQTGIWTPIGGEQTSTGYEVAWKETGANLYMIWNTDSNGTYLSSVQGNGTWVESYETSFQQDLNGDGVIGIRGGVAAPAAPQAGTGAATIATGATLEVVRGAQALTGAGSNDTFVFNADMGHATITNFQPASDMIQIDHALFANVQALLAAAQNDGHGDVIITADAHDTITLQNVTLAQLLAHQSGFHIT